MIFSVGDHIEQIISGEKTQTRRRSGMYTVGRTNAVQAGRSQRGISEGRILIVAKRVEMRRSDGYSISVEDALAEGGYSQAEFERLYERMDYAWKERFVYTFEFVPTEVVDDMSQTPNHRVIE